MPRLNGTGPRGLGPRSGWGNGPCGRGMGRGGCGFGRFGAYPSLPRLSKEEETEILKEEVQVLQEDLKEMQERLTQLKDEK